MVNNWSSGRLIEVAVLRTFSTVNNNAHSMNCVIKNPTINLKQELLSFVEAKAEH